MADEQAALLARIKALSGAIDQRRSTAESSRGGRGGVEYARGGGGGRGRGAGAGMYRHLQQPLPSRHRSLVLNANKAGSHVDGSGGAPSAEGSAVAAASAGPERDGWIKRKSTHNVSLVSSSTFEKTEPARLAAIAAKQRAAGESATLKAGHRTKTKASASVRRGDNMGEVIIDGVTFEFDQTGTKLVKKQAAPRAAEEEEADKVEGGEADVDATPLRTSINGQDFVRTKTGNLISQAVLDQRQENRLNSAKLKRMGEIGKEIAERQRLRNSGLVKAAASTAKARRAKTLCAYYTKTGQCKNGLRCPYKHDSSRIAICPRFLRPSGCPLTSASCALSHEPTPERVPHCVHFLASAGACRNGDQCRYTHPADANLLTNESPICMAFSDFGWCGNGRSCERRHTWDCPEFLRKGRCDRRGCKLMHVVRAPPTNGDENGAARAKQLDDDELFVRDDEAYVHPNGQQGEGSNGEDEGEDGGGEEQAEDEGRRTSRRKRPLDELGDVDVDEVDEVQHGLSFKMRKTKDFYDQNDFISFNDDQGEGEEEEEEEEEFDISAVDTDSDAE